MPKDKDATKTTTAEEVAPEAPVRPEEEPGKARFIRGDQVVDADGKVVEGLSVKDGEIVGTEK
jgi:hypothetical protein